MSTTWPGRPMFFFIFYQFSSSRLDTTVTSYHVFIVFTPQKSRFSPRNNIITYVIVLNKNISRIIHAIVKRFVRIIMSTVALGLLLVVFLPWNIVINRDKNIFTIYRNLFGRVLVWLCGFPVVGKWGNQSRWLMQKNWRETKFSNCKLFVVFWSCRGFFYWLTSSTCLQWNFISLSFRTYSNV